MRKKKKRKIYCHITLCDGCVSVPLSESRICVNNLYFLHVAQAAFTLVYTHKCILFYCFRSGWSPLVSTQKQDPIYCTFVKSLYIHFL